MLRISKNWQIGIVVAALILLAACEPTKTPTPTATPEPTQSPLPTPTQESPLATPTSPESPLLTPEAGAGDVARSMLAAVGIFILFVILFAGIGTGIVFIWLRWFRGRF